MPLSLLKPRGRTPYVLRPFWGDGEFRDNSEIGGIREKIAKGVGKTAVAREFRSQRGSTKGQKVTDNGELGTLEEGLSK